LLANCSSHAWQFNEAASAGKILAPAKTLEEMHRVVLNDYVDATLAALFVVVVFAMTVYGLIGIRRALGNSRVTRSRSAPPGPCREGSMPDILTLKE